MMYFIEKDMDEEARENFRKVIDQAEQSKPKTRRHLKAVPDAAKAVPVAEAKKWRAPEGWTPPGWNPEKSYSNAKQFMGFNASMKGKK